MNYCEEDGLHAIKLMAEVYLREIKRNWYGNVNIFLWSFFICSGDSGKF